MKNFFVSRRVLSGALSLFALFSFAGATFLWSNDVSAAACQGGTGICTTVTCGAGFHDTNDPGCQPFYCCVADTNTTPAPVSTCNGSCGYGGCGAGTQPGSGTCLVNGVPDSNMSCCVPFTAAPAPQTNPGGGGGLGLVQCGDGADNIAAANDCNFQKFIELLQRLMNFILFVLAIPIAAISFAWAGWLMLSSAGNEGKVKEAHQIFGSVALGLCLALAAWLIVHAIVKGLGVDEIYNFLGK